ncbi:quinone oxidoreductase family protein [Sporobolomyces koalae]|uniref:quinone oxidoreductase family protein n=1 Tax=Sporobolomyces koalae TaxID=500713 RepID=UPI0031789890
MKALTLHKTEGEFKPGPDVWHPIKLEDLPVPTPAPGQVLVKILASGFNHRDVFQRQSLYPGTIFSESPHAPSILGADAVGVVVSPDSPAWHNKRVLVAPAENWLESPLGPDVAGKQFGILGSVKQTRGRGTYAEYIAVSTDDLVECPAHLSNSEAAALPLGALTAYRAVFTKANVQKGDNVLITGIGGGVAILALQLCVAAGAQVWVSSSSEEKIKRAVELGAKGGINYRDATWPKTFASLLPASRPYLDAVIDSGGGPIAAQVGRVIKDGGIVACYGQTSGKPIEVNMAFILKNAELRGSTMGSRQEFFSAIAFIDQHRVIPVVDTVLPGLGEAEIGFELLKQGGQFGKVVITVAKDEKNKL